MIFFFSKHIEIYLCIQENIVKKNIYSGVPYYILPLPPKKRPQSVLEINVCLCQAFD